jgi:hypothetical protein
MLDLKKVLKEIKSLLIKIQNNKDKYLNKNKKIVNVYFNFFLSSKKVIKEIK